MAPRFIFAEFTFDAMFRLNSRIFLGNHTGILRGAQDDR